MTRPICTKAPISQPTQIRILYIQSNPEFSPTATSTELMPVFLFCLFLPSFLPLLGVFKRCALYLVPPTLPSYTASLFAIC